MSWSATKEPKILVKTVLSFLSFEERSGVLVFLGSEELHLLWVEPEEEFFCLKCEEPLDLESDLFKSDFSDLWPEVPEVVASWETLV